MDNIIKVIVISILQLMLYATLLLLCLSSFSNYTFASNISYFDTSKTSIQLTIYFFSIVFFMITIFFNWMELLFQKALLKKLVVLVSVLIYFLFLAEDWRTDPKLSIAAFAIGSTCLVIKPFIKLKIETYL